MIRVYPREGDRFGRAIELSAEAGDTLTTPVRAKFELALERVFTAYPRDRVTAGWGEGVRSSW